MSGKAEGVKAYKSPFHAMGYSEAEANALMRKADLAIAIEDAIARLGITQKEAAERAGVTPTQINEVVRGRIKGYSTDRLIRIIEALGQEVHLTVGGHEDDESAQHVARQVGGQGHLDGPEAGSASHVAPVANLSKCRWRPT